MFPRKTILHRRSIRLKGYDYSQDGLYFITICTQNRACLFGNIVNGEMILNEYGQIAFNEWMKTTEIRTNVELGDFVVMPNHFHGIVRIFGRGVSHTPQLDTPKCNSGVSNSGVSNSGVSNSGVSNSGECNPGGLHSGVCDTPLRSPSQTIGAIVRGYKSSVTKQLGLLGFNQKLWQRNYHEHIIRDEQSYINISDYIKNNPANWDNDSFKKNR
jgi:putative transposase